MPSPRRGGAEQRRSSTGSAAQRCGRPGPARLRPVDWRAVIRATMDERGGLATRQQLLERMPREVLDSHVGRSNLIRVFPRVYRLRTSGDDDVTALRAALLHAGPAAALSHTTALALWGVRPLERP